MHENLFRIVADLFEKSKGGEEVTSKIHRLRDEIKKVLEREDTVFSKFHELVESFRIIIPDEKQRYHVAIQALMTTSKLSRQEIVKAVNNHLDELKILEKNLLSSLPGLHIDLKTMESRSLEMKGEISKLREKITLLEGEEKVLLNSMAAREKEVERFEKSMRELFAEIGAEIVSIKNKVEEFTAEGAVARPIQSGASLKSPAPTENKEVSEQKIAFSEPSAQPDTESQKKCPMCGGRMNYQLSGEMWQCYVCAYEEAKNG